MNQTWIPGLLPVLWTASQFNPTFRSNSTGLI